MDSWKLPTILLCLYGSFKAMKPSESFLVPYLVGPDKNLTEESLDDEIFPVWTYSYLAVLVPVFLLTDLLKYKIVIIFEAFSLIATWALLIWAKGILAMQFMQFTYGIATATEIAYFSYIYAVVPSEKYKVVSGYVRGVLLFSKCLSGILGQVLISTHTANFLTLNVISFVSVCLCCIVAFVLPRVKHSTYFHVNELNELDQKSHKDSSSSINTETDHSINSGFSWSDRTNLSTIDASSLANSFGDAAQIQNHDTVMSTFQGTSTDVTAPNERNPKPKTVSGFATAFRHLYRDFVANYSNKALIVWSAWWAIASCGDFQVLNYAQNLWDVIEVNRTNAHIYNGAVDATSTLLGASSAFAISHISANWEAYGELLLAVVSLGNSALLVIMALTKSIWIAYIFYALFRAAYQMVITVATFQIAKHLNIPRYGLVFGVNTFVALALQTILTVIVVDKRGLHLGVRTQFVVTGVYFGAMGAVLLVAFAFRLRKHGCVSCTEEPYNSELSN